MRNLVIDTPRIDGQLLASSSELIEFLLSANRLVFLDPVLKERNKIVPFKEIDRNIYELEEISSKNLTIILEDLLTFDTLLMFKNDFLFAMFNDDFSNITLSI